MGSEISVTVKLFAIYQETYQAEQLTWQMPTGAIANDVLERIFSEHPHLANWRDVTRLGVNLEFVEPDTPLKSGDEVVLIPPVSGG
ncbi:MAG: MoaD/ThiS family protein [Limnothrix sp. RL_2_0]|nr:MoaD/ThiS family protein [Limnothrix sp. RL_2_0]